MEINAHSLFSKWFSESGKLVGKMFDKIRELVEPQDSFVCVLIVRVGWKVNSMLILFYRMK